MKLRTLMVGLALASAPQLAPAQSGGGSSGSQGGGTIGGGRDAGGGSSTPGGPPRGSSAEREIEEAEGFVPEP
jgi:hypothetical protein